MYIHTHMLLLQYDYECNGVFHTKVTYVFEKHRSLKSPSSVAQTDRHRKELQLPACIVSACRLLRNGQLPGCGCD